MKDVIYHLCHIMHKYHSTLTNTIPHKKQTIQVNTPLSFMITTSDKGSKYNAEQLFIAGNWGEAFLKLESILGDSVMAYKKMQFSLKKKKKVTWICELNVISILVSNLGAENIAAGWEQCY